MAVGFLSMNGDEVRLSECMKVAGLQLSWECPMARKSSNGGGKSSGAGTKDRTLSGVATEALNARGIDAGRSEVAAWIKETYPDFRYNENTLASTLSAVRRKMRGGAPAPGRRGRSAELSLQELRDVKALVQEYGGVKGFRQQMGPVIEAIGKVGSVGRLELCLAALEEFRA
jgi:hypothetical protein